MPRGPRRYSAEHVLEHILLKQNEDTLTARRIAQMMISPKKEFPNLYKFVISWTTATDGLIAVGMLDNMFHYATRIHQMTYPHTKASQFVYSNMENVRPAIVRRVFQELKEFRQSTIQEQTSLLQLILEGSIITHAAYEKAKEDVIRNNARLTSQPVDEQVNEEDEEEYEDDDSDSDSDEYEDEDEEMEDDEEEEDQQQQQQQQKPDVQQVPMTPLIPLTPFAFPITIPGFNVVRDEDLRPGTPRPDFSSGSLFF